MLSNSYPSELDEGRPAHRRHARRPHLGELETVHVQEDEELVREVAQVVNAGQQNLHTMWRCAKMTSI